MNEDRGIMTAEDVAAYMNLNYSTVVKYAKSGRIPAVQMGRKWIFHKKALDDFLIERSKQNLKASDAIQNAEDSGEGKE